MPKSSIVIVNQDYPIILPPSVLQQLNIQSGNHLIVGIQDDMIVLLPHPPNNTQHLAGLHSETWKDVDTNNYIYSERGNSKDR